MSRSNPSSHVQNPATRFYEWKGSEGFLYFYDKKEKKNVEIGDDFAFILLDSLSTIKGWHDASDSGIASNEVRDTKAETFVVKAFKGGILAEGLYSNIRDRIKAQGGKFVSNCYIAFRTAKDAPLQLGAIQFKGASLNAWVEFCKENRDELYKKGIRIKGSVEGKKGSVTFKVPKFVIVGVTEETEAQAIEIDKQLQEYLKAYFSRTRVEQVQKVAEETSQVEHSDEPPIQEPEPSELRDEVEQDDVPF